MTLEQITEHFEAEFRCEHAEGHVRLVHIVNSAGAKMFTKQCQRCGQSGIGGKMWVTPTGTPREIAAIPRRDEDLQPDWHQRKNVRHRELVEQFHKDRSREYREGDYLRTPHWRERAARALEFYGHECQMQMRGCTGHATEVHHLTYDNIGDEPLYELKPACRNCHERIELRKRNGINFLDEIGG